MVRAVAASPSITITPTVNFKNVLVMAPSPSDGQKAALTVECANAVLQGEHPQKCSGNDETRCRLDGGGCAILPHRKGSGDTVTRGGHCAVAGVARRRRWRARATDAARGGGVAPPGSWVHAPRAARPHATDHGVGERSVSSTDRRTARPLAGSCALSWDFGPPDAARARRSCAVARVSQTRGRCPASHTERRARRVAGTRSGRAGAGSRLGSTR